MTMPCIIIDALSIRRGGGLTVIERLASEFALSGIKVVVATAEKHVIQSLQPVADSAGFEILEIAAANSAFSAAWFRLSGIKKLIERTKAQGILSINYHTPCTIKQVTYHVNTIPFLPFFERVKLVGLIRGVFLAKNARNALDKSDLNIFESQYLRNLAAKSKVQINNPYVRYIGTETIEFNETSSLIENRIVAITSGAKHKRNDLLFQLHKEFNQEKADSERLGLAILGDEQAILSSLDSNTKEYAKSQAGIKFLGYCDRNRLFAELNSSLCLVSFSEQESFFMVAVEGMMASCPVICCSIESIEESVGDAGLLVPVGDVEQAIHHVQKLQDPAFRDELVRLGRAWGRQFHSKSCAQKIVATVCEEFGWPYSAEEASVS